MKFDDLKDKTIDFIKQRNHSKSDDGGYLDIIFTDGTKICIVGSYKEMWTGESINEYPTRIYLKEYGYEER